MSVIKVGFVDCHLLCTVIKVWVNYAITKTLSSEIMLVFVKLRTCLFLGEFWILSEIAIYL